jgi:hypothetical protein
MCRLALRTRSFRCHQYVSTSAAVGFVARDERNSVTAHSLCNLIASLTIDSLVHRFSVRANSWAQHEQPDATNMSGTTALQLYMAGFQVISHRRFWCSLRRWQSLNLLRIVLRGIDTWAGHEWSDELWVQRRQQAFGWRNVLLRVGRTTSHRLLQIAAVLKARPRWSHSH